MGMAAAGTKTISLKTEAYERLRGARRYAGESFSEIVLRASWPEDTVTGRSLLAHWRAYGPVFSGVELDRVEATRAADAPPEDKWQDR